VTGFEGAMALGAVWGWLAGGWTLRGPRAWGTAAAVLAATALAAAETVALVERRAAALPFVAGVAAGLAVHRGWRARLLARAP
jgi:hypothetical protein